MFLLRSLALCHEVFHFIPRFFVVVYLPVLADLEAVQKVVVVGSHERIAGRFDIRSGPAVVVYVVGEAATGAEFVVTGFIFEVRVHAFAEEI